MRIAMIGTYAFPYGEAASNRILAMAKAIKKAGHEPIVIGRGMPRQEDKTSSDNYVVEGIEYFSYGTIIAKTIMERYKRPVKALEKLNEKYAFDIVLIYASATYMFTPAIMKFCNRNNIEVMADVVEWYTPSNFKYKIFDIRYHVFSFVFKRYFVKIKKLFVTSTYLRNYFEKHSARILHIPATIDVHSMLENKHSDKDKKTFIYAGMPGKKDLLGNSIQSLNLLSDEELKNVEYIILGPTKKVIEELIGTIPERIESALSIKGRVSVDKVSQYLSQSDFTILIRGNNRVTKAGFPSKIPEAMGHGVVPIITDTSDLKMFLSDGVDSLFLSDTSEEECAKAIKKAISLTDLELKEMKDKAVACASKTFDYNCFIERIKQFI